MLEVLHLIIHFLYHVVGLVAYRSGGGVVDELLADEVAGVNEAEVLQKSMSLKFEPALEPLHISVK